MKKLIVLLVMMCSLAPVLRAADGCNQRLSPAEFRARQKAYITEKAGLTKEEAIYENNLGLSHECEVTLINKKE